jgi:NTP pyrophosphatase (non-canonical NTP hydrolase)
MLEKKGLVKLTEECGELIQICSKKMARMNTDEHWDKAGKLSERLENEIADVIAAASIVVENFNLDADGIQNRAFEKMDKLRGWMKAK